MTMRLNKPLRKMLAQAVAKEIDSVFGGQHNVAQGQGLDSDEFQSEGFPFHRYVYAISTGELSVDVTVCPAMVSLYCQLRPNGAIGEKLSEDERALARLVNGNEISGKANLHLMPKSGSSIADFERETVNTIRDHLLTLKHGTRNYAKEAA